jgi:hypothetical protein
MIMIVTIIRPARAKLLLKMLVKPNKIGANCWKAIIRMLGLRNEGISKGQILIGEG